jgi:hypothetical protein
MFDANDLENRIRLSVRGLYDSIDRVLLDRIRLSVLGLSDWIDRILLDIQFTTRVRKNVPKPLQGESNFFRILLPDFLCRLARSCGA